MQANVRFKIMLRDSHFLEVGTTEAEYRKLVKDWTERKESDSTSYYVYTNPEGTLAVSGDDIIAIHLVQAPQNSPNPGAWNPWVGMSGTN